MANQNQESCQLVSQSHYERSNFGKLLFFPSLVSHLDFQSLCTLPLINKALAADIRDRPEMYGYWQAMCCAFARHAGLHTYSFFELLESPKRYFFSELWLSRKKWNQGDVNETSVGESFKVKVVCRFRPGERTDDRFSLPLHQFLKLRRKQLSAASAASLSLSSAANASENAVFVGAVDPEEFVDPFLGVLMRDPVLLLSSGRVVERAVAMQCLQRNSRDPFTETVLSADMIIPQPVLAARIAEWRVDQASRRERGISLSVTDMAPLLQEGGAADMDVLQALMDLERLQLAASRAEIDASATAAGQVIKRWNSDRDRDTNGSAGQGQGPEEDENFENLEREIVGVGRDDLENIQINANHAAFLQSDSTEAEKDEDRHGNKKEGGARVVDCNVERGVVNMHMQGVGVKPFRFSNVHVGDGERERLTGAVDKGKGSQRDVYVGSVRDSVTAALNGFNAAILCYGQTGSFLLFLLFE